MKKTNVIKLRFLKYGEPQGYEYTYYTPEPVEVGDIVAVSTNNAVVTCINVPKEEIEQFGDKAKSIIGKEVPTGGVVFSKMEKRFLEDTIRGYLLEEISDLAKGNQTAKSTFKKLGLLESEK